MARSRLQWVAPANWHYKESVTLLSPDGQANVIFSSEPLPEDVDLEKYATGQLDVLEGEFHHFEQVGADEFFELRGVGPAIRRRFTWIPPDGAPVTQIQLYAVSPGWGYTATATTISTTFSTFEPLLSEALASLSVSHVADEAAGTQSMPA